MYTLTGIPGVLATVLPRMDGARLIGGCVTLLLSFSTVCCLQCNYRYLQQPGKASCNPEAPLSLELRCQVVFTGDDNSTYAIQWHYSNSSSPPSIDNSTSMETVLENETHNMIEIKEIIHNDSFQESVLRLTYSETASGHYWCTVNTTQPDQDTPNPSHVVNINICPKADSEGLQTVCSTQVDLFEPMDRCANDIPTIADIYIEEVQLWSKEICVIENRGEDATTTDETFPSRDQSTQSTTSPTSASGFPMQYVWMIVGIAFGALIVIIVIMLAAIIYLNYKKNKIKVFTMTRSHARNPYIESNNTEESPRSDTLVGATTAQQEIKAEAGGYEIPTNVIHAHNTTFGGDHSPDSKTSSSSRSVLHSPPGEYEELSIVKQTRDSIKSTQRHQYDLVESGEQSEYSHLQHAHGGSRKFSTNSTGTAPPPSRTQNRGKVSITSSLSLSGHHPEPIFDSPEYATIELNGSKSTKTRPETGEGVINQDAGYSHINNEVLPGTMDTTGEAEGTDLDSEGYHQLPSVFTGVVKQHVEPNSEIIPKEGNKSHTTNTHPSARRHKSATLASGHGPYTPLETTNVMKRNAYSFTIVSTDEQYVSERGHVYHLLERSDEHQHNRSIPGSNEGSPLFRIQKDESMEDGKESTISIPPYGQVNESPEQDHSDKQKETAESEDQSDSSSAQESNMESSHKVIPPYSQVDKSKKKNRQPQAQLDAQLNQETHHYHILEHNSEDKTEQPSGEKGGPIYHAIDHEP